MDVADFPPNEHVSRDLQISFRFPGKGQMELRIPPAHGVCTRDGVVRADAQLLKTQHVGLFALDELL